jgi:hypothetical protein
MLSINALCSLRVTMLLYSHLMKSNHITLQYSILNICNHITLQYSVLNMPRRALVGYAGIVALTISTWPPTVCTNPCQ